MLCCLCSLESLLIELSPSEVCPGRLQGSQGTDRFFFLTQEGTFVGERRERLLLLNGF